MNSMRKMLLDIEPNRMKIPFLLAALAVVAQAADDKPGRQGGGSRQVVQSTKCSEVPAHAFDLVLGRPTATAITVSVLSYGDTDGCIAYGTRAGQLTGRTPVRKFARGEPVEVVLADLQPDTRYFYQFLAVGGAAGAEATFHTARPPGRSFVFTVTADPHQDEHTEPAIYQETLANALADQPDFHVDLGDTFMSEKHATREAAAMQYLAQRYYFGQLCRSAPLFLVLGNHDGETPNGPGRDAAGLALWSNTQRKRYFPNPVPDRFYTGDAVRDPQAGLLQDYYAWQWGDARCIVLDPFWFSRKAHGKDDNWSHTLGDDQYQWLKRTLESGKPKFTFVFIHHLVGGAGGQCRGGAEAAPNYEWGGRNADGSDGFQQHRPGWPAPIHRLLADHHVSVVFHGHDHFYAKQQLDGIIYQEVPQPGAPGSGGPPRSAAEYGYQNGVLLGSSGHLRVQVAPDAATVTYIRAHPQDRQGGGDEAAATADRYTVGAAK